MSNGKIFRKFSLGVAAIVSLAVTCIPAESFGGGFQKRQVAMAYRRTPPMMLTYFTMNEVPSSQSSSESASSRRYSNFYLGIGGMGALIRDTAVAPGNRPIGYGGAEVTFLWQPQTSWLIRGGVGYVARTFSISQDPTGSGFGTMGQHWLGTLSIEYQWLTSGGIRLSSGWAHQLSYGYRSAELFSAPTYGGLAFYRTGIGSTARIDVGSGIDIYVQGQWLFGIGQPWESQGTVGAGLLIGLD